MLCSACQPQDRLLRHDSAHRPSAPRALLPVLSCPHSTRLTCRCFLATPGRSSGTARPTSARLDAYSVSQNTNDSRLETTPDRPPHRPSAWRVRSKPSLGLSPSKDLRHPKPDPNWQQPTPADDHQSPPSAISLRQRIGGPH